MRVPDGLPVTDLQRALRDISRAESEIEAIIPDGMFGPETTRAVQQFQRGHGLNPSGKADLETWNAIFDHAAQLRKDRAPAREVQFFPPGENILLGSSGDPVFAVQMMLHTLSDNFNNFDPVERSGFYDANTERQIRRFQNTAALPEHGVTDKPTWNALSRAHSVWRAGNTRPVAENERVPPFGR